MNLEEMTLDIEQQIEVDAPAAEVYKGMLHRFGKGFAGENGETLGMELEEFAGGRWYRDRGEGVQHLWGHVQVLKPSSLIELAGPMFMSYPAINHIEVKLSEAEGKTTVRLRHRALGMLDATHRANISTGWTHMFELVAADFAKAAGNNA